MIEESFPTPEDAGRRAMAIHEAGHQVVAIALNVRSNGVVLREDSGQSFDGVNRNRYHRSELRYWELLDKEILILLAGEFAVRQFYDQTGDMSDEYGSRKDRAALQPLIRELAEDQDVPPPMLLLRKEIEVSGCLDQRWWFVELLAQNLLTSGALSGDDVKRLLRDMPRL